MTEEPTLQMGYTSPMWRAVAPFSKREPPRKREPIGFVHFGPPEEEPRSYLDEYIAVVMEGLEEFDDQLHVGFTAPLDVI